MRVRLWLTPFVLLIACAGCGKKSTDQLVGDAQSGQDGERLAAVRLLAQRKGEAEKVVPALVKSLKDREPDVRWSAAIALGNFGEQAREAVPALQEAQHDRDARVREAAGVALSRIDPGRFAAPGKPKHG